MPEIEELEVDHDDPITQGIRTIAQGALAQTDPVTFEPSNDAVALLWLDPEPEGFEVHDVEQRSATVNEEVVQRSPLSAQSGQRTLVLAAAAVIVVATAGLATWRTLDGAGDRTELGDSTTAASADEHHDSSPTTKPIGTHLPALPAPYVDATYTTVSDPMDIDLRFTVASAGQTRLAETSADITTVSLETLPTGWVVSQETGQAVPDSDGGAWLYSHDIELAGPDGFRAAIRVDGTWSDVMAPAPQGMDEAPDLLPNASFSTYDVWEPNEQVRITLAVTRPTDFSSGGSDEQHALDPEQLFADVLSDLRSSLQTLAEAPLPGSVGLIDEGTARGVDALLAGRGPAALNWALLRRDPATKPILRIGLEPHDLVAIVSVVQTNHVDLAEGLDLTLNAAPVPGGHLLFGEAPPHTNVAWLTNETIDGSLEVIGIPVDATQPNALPVFAVPIDDRTDPIRLDFLSSTGDVLEAVDLSVLPPSRE